MAIFTIIISDKKNTGKNEQGFPLVGFLSIYFKPTQINILHVSDLQNTSHITTKYLFIIIPTSLKPTQLKNISYEKVFLADYGDGTEPCWYYTDINEVLKITNTYFKTSRIKKNKYDLDIKLLPLKLRPISVKRYGILPPKTLEKRKFDINFIGAPTYLEKQNKKYNQRIEWLREVSSKYKFYGGLINSAAFPKERLEKEFGNMNNIYFNRKYPLSHFAFFQTLHNSKIALVPTGHSRWTYRHYEAICCRCALISNDIKGTDLLIPLPTENMPIVSDHEPISSYIDNILENPHINNKIVEKNFAFINQYLKNGYYCKSRKKTIEKFLDQL
jgi:hypothetical protein